MGRRFWIMISGFLVASITGASLRAQEEPKVEPDLGVPTISVAPEIAPAELGEAPRVPRTRKTEPAAVPKPEWDAKSAVMGGLDDAKKPSRPHSDPAIHQAVANAPGDPPATPEPAQGADASRLAVDRLPLGKQSVAVTVDVQAPASMNLNQEGTLRLLVKNTGSSDAMNVTVCDELPEGLVYVSSTPEARLVGGSLLTWRVNNLPAGSDRLITVKVKPTRSGPFEHGATVTFLTGGKARTRVLEPKLKVDLVANPTVGKVLKGQSVTFQVVVTNTGDGPARDVTIQAKLSPGLKHDSGETGDDRALFELTLPELAAGQHEKLDALVADAILGGEQSCVVVARSGDVVFNKDEAEVVKTVTVVEPKLKLALKGPDSRYTDTTADYELSVENPGTAPARRVRVLATLPVNGRLVKPLPDAHYDATTRRLQWTIDSIEPGAKPLVFPFHVRMGGVGDYEIVAQGVGDGALKAMDRRHTEVVGMPDVDLVVSEMKRVVDVGGKTTFQIRLRNYGTKEASHIQITAKLSKNLKVEAAGSSSTDIKQQLSPDGDELKFSEIDKLGPGKELVLGILVKVASDTPRLATCRVLVSHEDLPEPFEDMAAVKITSARRSPVAASGP